MKKIILVIIAVLMVISTLTCCTFQEKVLQTNTETPAVMNAEASEAKNTETPAINYTFPKIVKDSWMSSDNGVTITVDAKVVTPDVGKYPVISVEPAQISMDFVKKASEALLEGKQAYEPKIGLSKDEISEQILDYKKALADPKNSGSEALNGFFGSETVQNTIELFENRIKILEELYKTAPNDYVRKEAEYVFRPASYYEDPVMLIEDTANWKKSDDISAKQLLEQHEKEQKIVLDADLDGGFYGRIFASNLHTDWINSHYFHFSKAKTLLGDNTPDSDHALGYLSSWPEVKISEQDAIKLAEDTLNKLGLTNMVLKDSTPDFTSDKKTFRYFVRFVPEYQGIPLLYSEASLDEVGRPAYISEYDEAENIIITVEDSGITSLIWNWPQKIKIIENDNVDMLDFEQIMEHAKNLKYDLRSPMVIDEISLVLIKTPKKDNLNDYYLVPAWVFSGYADPEFGHLNEDDVWGSGPNQRMPLAAINAMDGSTIPFSPSRLGRR